MKSKIESRALVIAVRIMADNDVNGNPRRGWMCYRSVAHYGARHLEFIRFVDEGYSGRLALLEVFPRAQEIGWIPTTPRFYREAKKGE